MGGLTPPLQCSMDHGVLYPPITSTLCTCMLTGPLGNWSDNFFDITMTYRMDSQIFNALFEIVPKSPIPPRKLIGGWLNPDFTDESNAKDFRHKRRFASWLVSKCVTPGRREEYVNELQKLVNIHIYGNCVQNPLPK
jgi:alpha-1,3-fucosyltransferase